MHHFLLESFTVQQVNRRQHIKWRHHRRIQMAIIEESDNEGAEIYVEDD